MKRAEIEALTAEQVEKATRAMETVLLDPLAFLKGRLDRNQARLDGIVQAEQKIKAGKQIRDSIRTPGEAVPVVTVKVRKIQMPEEAQ